MRGSLRVFFVGLLMMVAVVGCGGGPQSSGSSSPVVAAPPNCAPDAPPAAIVPPSGQATILQLQTSGGGIPKPGGTIDLNLNMASTNSPRPSALQWTLAYSSCLFSSATVAPGQSLTAASKGVVCDTRGRPGLLTCVAYGLNQNEIADGTVATLRLSVAGIGTNATFTIQEVVVSPPNGATGIQTSGSAIGI